MDVGMMMVFASYGWENCPDDRVWDEEIRLARLAADSGFDCLWSAEHHFNDYSFVPDNLQLMTYLTALCPGVDLGTAAVIVPWHDPLRVAEQAAVLDMLSHLLAQDMNQRIIQMRGVLHGDLPCKSVSQGRILTSQGNRGEHTSLLSVNQGL